VTASEHIQGILDNLPTRPGVYLMKNAEGEVIYVGKAVNLRSRVRSYFQASAVSSPFNAKTAQLVREIADLDFIVLDSELEALLTELTLIKHYRPRFNVRLKDDKRYPYIKVHWAEPFPHVTVTRRMAQDGSRYFGPYTSAAAVYQTLDVLRRAFPYLTCNRDITGQDERACLYYDIKLCNAPCIGAVSQEEYRQIVHDLMDFLRGRSEEIVAALTERMHRAADALDFERAARLRDQLEAIYRVTQHQKVISPTSVDQDVIAFARENGDTCAQVFFIRNGKIIGREYFVLESAEDEAPAELVSEFVKQFYNEAAEVPPEVLLPNEIEEARIIEEWLNTRRGNKVILTVPHRGKKKDLVRMACENAAETLAMLRAQWASDTHRQEAALQELQEALGLPNRPNRIECYDVSNTQGTAIVASRVVFVKGAPRKSEYRRFNIRTVMGQSDDYASLREALTRRFRRWAEAQKSDGKEVDPTWAMLPDLLIVDGGKGQVSMGVEVLADFGLTDAVPLIGLAKQYEEVFRPGQSRPLVLPRRSQGLYLLQRVRDEAHRFALAHHRQRRRKAGVASILDSIPGVGPTRRKALLTAFASLNAIREATEDDLAAVPGIGPELAAVIKASLG
jgi:excinuclease ABC subunit C